MYAQIVPRGVSLCTWVETVHDLLSLRLNQVNVLRSLYAHIVSAAVGPGPTEANTEPQAPPPPPPSSIPPLLPTPVGVQGSPNVIVSYRQL